jgi:subtilisin family serine protease
MGLALLALVVCAGATAFAETATSAKQAPDLAAEAGLVASSSSMRVIVDLAPGASVSALATAAGATRAVAIPEFGLAVLDLPGSALPSRLDSLAASSSVKYVVPNRPLLATQAAPAVDGHVRTTTGVAQLAGLDGRGVTVAVLDSGIADHAALKDGTASRIAARADFTGEASALRDPYGHGSHVAGLISGNGALAPAGRPLSGAAPKAKLADVRVLRSDGTGSLDGLLMGLAWTLANKDRYGIRVVNLSVGTAPKESFETDPLCRAVEKLVDAGLVVVVAAGNHGKLDDGTKVYGGILSPANAPKVITVGAANSFQTDGRSDDGVASYSSRGPTRSYRERDLDGDGLYEPEERRYDDLMKPDLVAPGNRLVSLQAPGSRLALEHPDLARGASYLELSGTSMAAPVVAGTVALMLQARPDLTPALAKSILMYTAQALPDASFLDQGAGLLNASLAVSVAKQLVANPGTLALGATAAPALDLRRGALATTIAGLATGARLPARGEKGGQSPQRMPSPQRIPSPHRMPSPQRMPSSLPLPLPQRTPCAR